MDDINYDIIAEDYDHKQRKPWKSLERFISELKSKGYRFNGVNIDLGCANGRHFKLFCPNGSILIGMDNSFEFLKIALNRLNDYRIFSREERNNVHLILADLKNIPIRNNKVDNLFSIASLHHIRERVQRKSFFFNLKELLKNNGKALISAWRKWQPNYKNDFLKDFLKRKTDQNYLEQQIEKGLVEFGDRLVPWTVSEKKMTIQRFYHFFSCQELKNLLKDHTIEEFKILGGSTGKDNFFILIRRGR